ncbi:MAG: hypothetical protein R2932_07475 [Caldilineaceae bacterium]
MAFQREVLNTFHKVALEEEEEPTVGKVATVARVKAEVCRQLSVGA